MEEKYCVKGSSIQTKLAFAHERWGAGAQRELEQHLHGQGISRILDGKWYPFELYDGLLRHISDTYFHGDLVRLTEIGEFSAEKSFNATYKAYAVGTFLSALNKLALLHGRFYNLGQMEVSVDAADHHAVIRLHSAPYYSDADLQVARGFYLGSAKYTGLTNVVCDLRIGDYEVLFKLTWS